MPDFVLIVITGLSAILNSFCVMMLGSCVEPERKMAKQGLTFLPVIFAISFIWIVWAETKPSTIIKTEVIPVYMIDNMQVCNIDGKIINLNDELNQSIPEGSSIRVDYYNKWCYGVYKGTSKDYKLTIVKGQLPVYEIVK